MELWIVELCVRRPLTPVEHARQTGQDICLNYFSVCIGLRFSLARSLCNWIALNVGRLSLSVVFRRHEICFQPQIIVRNQSKVTPTSDPAISLEPESRQVGPNTSKVSSGWRSHQVTSR